MARVTQADITEAGWTAAQFTTEDGWDFNEFVEKLTERASRETRHRMGAVAYDAVVADSVEEDRVVEAELAFCESRLWRKRAAHWDAGSASSLDDAAYLTQREFLKQGVDAWKRYQSTIDLLQTDSETLGSGFAISVVETGPYPLEGTS